MTKSWKRLKDLCCLQEATIINRESWQLKSCHEQALYPNPVFRMRQWHNQFVKPTHTCSSAFMATECIFSPRLSYDIVMPDTQSRHQKPRWKGKKNLKITVSSDKRLSDMTQRRVAYITVKCTAWSWPQISSCESEKLHSGAVGWNLSFPQFIYYFFRLMLNLQQLK